DHQFQERQRSANGGPPDHEEKHDVDTKDGEGVLIPQAEPADRTQSAALVGVEGQDFERGIDDQRAEEKRKDDTPRDVDDDQGVEQDEATEIHPPRDVNLALLRRRDPGGDGNRLKDLDGLDPQNYAK